MSVIIIVTLIFSLIGAIDYLIGNRIGVGKEFEKAFSLGIFKQNQHKEPFFGLLCGIVTIPIGSFVAGLICELNPLKLFINLLPLVIISAIVAVALIFGPRVCIKCFSIFGFFMKALAVIGLVCSI